ncbi:MAG: DMT family transporter [Pikeienuella sp.]
MQQQNVTLGLISAVGVIFVWSGFVVFSRMGLTSALTPYDVAALRFAVAGLATLPFAWAWWPRHLPLRVQALIALTGPGIIYGMMMYLGLARAPAAYGGVFANGSLPIFTMLLGVFIAGEKPGPRRVIAVGVIVAGAVMLGWRGMTAGQGDVIIPIALFLGASMTLSIYIFSVRRWNLTPTQALAVVNIPNTLVFLPLWYFALPSNMVAAEMSDMIFQALFQGLGPGFLAVILIALTSIHLGPTPAAGFAAVVPAVAAVAAIPLLGEVPTPLEWGGVITVSVGLGLLLIRQAQVAPKPRPPAA